MPTFSNKTYTKGFTLVETLVAISILSLSILATFTAVQSGLQSSEYAKDQVTAFYLTQEVMEFIKNIRDENALHSLDGTSVNWLHGLSEAPGQDCFFGRVCYIDSPLKIVSNSDCVFFGNSGQFGTCPFLKQDPVTGLFGYTSGWTPTNFRREIKFESLTPDEVRVIINLSWTTRGVAKSFQVSQLLFNRQ